MNIVRSDNDDNDENVNLNTMDYPRRHVEENFSWEKIAGEVPRRI